MAEEETPREDVPSAGTSRTGTSRTGVSRTGVSRTGTSRTGTSRELAPEPGDAQGSSHGREPVSLDGLRRIFEKDLECRLPRDWEDRNEALYRLVVDANSGCNLTRLTDRADFLIKHVADSLLLARAWPEIRDNELRVADIGCGAGLPGLVLALSFPRLRVTEVDSASKKITCVERFIAELSLEHCSAVASRARELGRRPDFQGTFDLVVARAVAPTAALLRETRQLLTQGGALIAYKTPAQVTEELPDLKREAARRKLSVRASECYQLPAAAGERQFLIVS